MGIETFLAHIAVNAPQYIILAMGVWVILTENKTLRDRIDVLEKKLDDCIDEMAD